MNIQNLNSNELRQLQVLLNKMNPAEIEPEIDTIDQMINEIDECFNWNKVQITMEHLHWRWSNTAGGLTVPSITNLKETAHRLLRSAADGILTSTYDNLESGFTVGTGGFQATAYCNESRTAVVLLDLKFVLVEWDAELTVLN